MRACVQPWWWLWWWRCSNKRVSFAGCFRTLRLVRQKTMRALKRLLCANCESVCVSVCTHCSGPVGDGGVIILIVCCRLGTTEWMFALRVWITLFRVVMSMLCTYYSLSTCASVLAQVISDIDTTLKRRVGQHMRAWNVPTRRLPVLCVFFCFRVCVCSDYLFKMSHNAFVCKWNMSDRMITYSFACGVVINLINSSLRSTN